MCRNIRNEEVNSMALSITLKIFFIVVTSFKHKRHKLIHPTEVTLPLLQVSSVLIPFTQSNIPQFVKWGISPS